MKSMNVKRIAAVAAGVAMVGSVMASGLAVQESGDVNGLVSSIKANLNDVQVVVGTQGADISDGVQAAKIAAVLASVNYKAVSGGKVTVKEKSVTLETSAGATEQITTISYPAELTANSTASSHYATNPNQNFVLTKDMLSGVLAQKSIQATVNSTAGTYTYEDRILLNNISAQYGEADSTSVSGHGLYLYAPSSAGAIEYRVTFGGSGLPVGTGRSYASIPEIDLLGRTTGIDYTSVQDGSMYIFAGTKTTMYEGDEVSTSDGYKVHLDVVSQGSSNTYNAIYTATDPSGLQETSGQLTTNGEWQFFGNKLSIRVDYVGYNQGAAKGLAITRVMAGKQLLANGLDFPLDTNWSVKDIQVSGGTVAGYLEYISLKYGSSKVPGTFSGTVQTGLAQGTVLDGPKMADGTPKFQLKLKGFGSASQVIDSTKVEVTALGTSGSGLTPTHILQPSWTARDGSLQTLDATMPAYVVIPSSGSGGASFNTATGARWMIVNDKVVYTTGAYQSAGSSTQYMVDFYIGGSSGTKVSVGPFTNATGSTATFSYTSAANPISCTVTLGQPNGVNDLTNITLTQSGSVSYSTDTPSGAVCDAYPDIVPIGAATLMTTNTGTPWMDLRYIQGGAGQANNFTFNESGTGKQYPVLTLVAPAMAENITVVYDSEAGTTGLYGLRAYLNLYQKVNSTGVYFENPQEKTALVDQSASTTLYENSLYDITPFSTELDGSVKFKLSAWVPETRRNTIVEVSKTIGNATDAGVGTYTAMEGQTVGNVKVKAITCSAEAAGSGIFEQSVAMTPESLVVYDTGASKTYQIVVGGPWVNKVAQTFANKGSVESAGAQYLVAEGNRLLVAGYAATDTAAAADALINKLKA